MKYRCARCGLYFNTQDMRSKGDRYTYCKPCDNERLREWRLKNIQHYRKYMRDRARTYRAKYPGKSTQYSAKERLLHPGRSLARQKVCRAIGKGKMIKQPCEICGAPAIAHHDDYSKPLDVRWFCQAHHLQLHRESKYASCS